MLNNIRNFAKTKLAGVLVAILIVPFVLWGMGGVFSGGNKNNIVKINNENISTLDFQKHLNSSNVDLEKIKKNIDKNIIEEILGELISKKMLSMEIDDLKLIVTDKILNKKIKKNESFLDEDNKFSRIKYEKFLLSNKITAPSFESRLKKRELEKDLFNYLGGGLYSPLFLVDKNYKEQTKKITINYINLTNIYKKKDSFTNKEIQKFVEENKDKLNDKLINFKYTKINPQNLLGLNDFNNLFFEKIDEIENDVLNGVSYEEIIKKYNLESSIKKNFKINDYDSNKFYKKIYENGKINKIELLDENDFYVLYEIIKTQKKLPDLKNEKFVKKIKEMLFNKKKYEFNSDLINKISERKFDKNDFEKISNNNFSTEEIDSINDDEKFNLDSVKYIYSKSKNDFALISDNDLNIYLINVVNVSYKNISNNSENFLFYKKQANDKIMNTIFSSYDFFLNDKYKIKINEKTLVRVKNYFQ
tara:strand:+ start:1192 stop:2616 length:1425 start_codon:yes stop_codon:yes gene_type:complete